jgi:Domain of unknown function (DUF4055)
MCELRSPHIDWSVHDRATVTLVGGFVMPIDTKHALYLQRQEQWQRCRDAYDGSDAIKARSTTYLPQLTGQTKDEYAAYLLRAMWYGATGRTVDGLTGTITRKPGKIDVPTALDAHLDDITLSGTPLEVFIKELLSEILKIGRGGVLVDMGRDITVSDPLTTRPYWITYTAEQIINWRVETAFGKQQLIRVVLSEEYEVVDLTDPFVTTYQTRYRELTLDKGQYVVRLHTPTTDANGVQSYAVETVTPVVRGDALKEIPFCFIGICGLNTTPEKPPLLDLVDVNLSHYRSSADLEHGRHFTALPTPWIAGFPADTVVRIGSAVAWVSSDPNAKAGMLEFTGQGLGGLEKALETKEKQMAVLGARMLEEQRTGVETFETTALRTSGERSVLQSIASVVSLGITRLLRWHAQWMGITEQDAINAELNQDFISTQLSGSELTELVKAWQASAISYETLYWNLQRGEVTRPDIEAEEERTLIDTQQAAQLEREAAALVNEDMSGETT